jgi:hypothetical protein
MISTLKDNTAVLFSWLCVTSLSLIQSILLIDIFANHIKRIFTSSCYHLATPHFLSTTHIYAADISKATNCLYIKICRCSWIYVPYSQGRVSQFFSFLAYNCNYSWPVQTFPSQWKQDFFPVKKNIFISIYKHLSLLQHFDWFLKTYAFGDGLWKYSLILTGLVPHHSQKFFVYWRKKCLFYA